jgi:hypothetical protein
MVIYVQLGLDLFLSITCTFDLWMLKGAMHDMFIVVINFISNNWEVKHVTIGLFEVNETNGMAMAPNLNNFLISYSLITIF